MKKRQPISALKKVVVELQDRTTYRGYLNPAQLRALEAFNLLTPDGSHQAIQLADIRSVYFVREFGDNFQPERKTFLSRPKLPGVWVRLRYKTEDEDQEGEVLEGILDNNLLDLMDRGVHLTPPDFNGPCTRVYVPRTAISEMTVLGLVGVGPRQPRKPKVVAAPSSQRSLFEDAE